MEQSSFLWLGLITGFPESKVRNMNLEASSKFSYGVIPEKKIDRLEVLKKAIKADAYKVKTEAIAERILKKRLFDFALAQYIHNYSPGN